MGVSYNSVINRDGLVLHLVAGNSRSYPGSGTTWYDLSGGNNHVTLINGPTYSANNGGIITFDYTDDYGSGTIPVGSALTSLTMACWVKATSTNNRTVLFNYGSTIELWYPLFNTGNAIALGTPGFAFVQSINNQVVYGQWKHVCITRSSTASNSGAIYLNGESLSLSSNISGSFGAYGSTIIGARSTSDFRLNGQLEDIRMYNRALSPVEIRQIFNSTRRRFGV